MSNTQIDKQIDRNSFRDAMARLAAAVSIVTSDGPGGLCGGTASAVCSVSDEPPILLVCINRTSRNNMILKQNQRLCVNVLRAEHQALATEFSRSGASAAQRFANGDWSRGAGVMGADEAGSIVEIISLPNAPMPALDQALASLDCRITDSAEIGSHTVFYCTVESVRFGAPGAALVYFERDFHAVENSASTVGS